MSSKVSQKYIICFLLAPFVYSPFLVEKKWLKRILAQKCTQNLSPILKKKHALQGIEKNFKKRLKSKTAMKKKFGVFDKFLGCRRWISQIVAH